MAKFTNRDNAFNIAGSHMFGTSNDSSNNTEINTQEEETGVETKVRKSKTTAKKQADNSETRPVTCYMPKDLYKRLRIESIEQESSMTNLMIAALEEFFNNHARR